MRVSNLFHQYEWRHTLSSTLAVAAACVAGCFIGDGDALWAALSALLVVQTSRGTPARQALYSWFVIMMTVIAGFMLNRYIAQPDIMVIILMLTALFCSVMLMLRQPDSDQMTLKWVLPPVIFLLSAGWPASNEMMLVHRLVLIVTGSALGMLCLILVLPVRPYREFQLGLSPILDALIHYSSALEHYMLNHGGQNNVLDRTRLKIEMVIQSRQNEYPEWVFEAGFNRDLRASFRYVLVQIERVTEAFFSLDYHARQPMDPELLTELAPHLALVLGKNAELLQIIHKFFAGESIGVVNENFTSDITDVNNSLRNVLPGSVELLDVSPDYVNLAALARDVIDIRELLLQLLAGLPIDDLMVTNNE